MVYSNRFAQNVWTFSIEHIWNKLWKENVYINFDSKEPNAT